MVNSLHPKVNFLLISGGAQGLEAPIAPRRHRMSAEKGVPPSTISSDLLLAEGWGTGYERPAKNRKEHNPARIYTLNIRRRAHFKGESPFGRPAFGVSLDLYREGNRQRGNGSSFLSCMFAELALHRNKPSKGSSPMSREAAVLAS